MIDLKGSLIVEDSQFESVGAGAILRGIWLWWLVRWECRTCTEITTRRLTTCSRWCWSETRPSGRPSCWLALQGMSSASIQRLPSGSSSRPRRSSSITRPSRLRYGTLLAKRGVSCPYSFIIIIMTFCNKFIMCHRGENCIGLDLMCMVKWCGPEFVICGNGSSELL